ncbi:histidine kinase [Uliginosibacterium sp. H3]|uniref:Histidine kinase n=1 Tax=Uliginosibacterium silvisoli TaxID=3114758 RepID=A0ABU6K6C1_9RHOO|nr:histidine kinase [Uliginosibacterium sp. H3]
MDSIETPGGTRHATITQREYGLYVLGLLPASVVVNFVGGLAITVILLPWQDFWRGILCFQILGSCMLLGAVSMRWVRQFLLPPHSEKFPWHLLIGVPGGLVAGLSAVHGLFRRDVDSLLQQHGGFVITLAVISSAILGTVYFSIRWRVAHEQWRGQRAQRAALAARLRALQAQVEPHFLFNTLANLNALICQSPKDARALLAHLQHYLQASLSHNRETTTLLATELALLEAYLKIMAIRLPDRLHIHVECAADCARLPFPPMLLQPLVENAVIHGIEPSTTGGHIVVRAVRSADTLQIEVADTGVGLDHTPPKPHSNNSGLENVRERLAALFGRHAALYVQAQVPRGTRACVHISVASLQARA